MCIQSKKKQPNDLVFHSFLFRKFAGIAFYGIESDNADGLCQRSKRFPLLTAIVDTQVSEYVATKLIFHLHLILIFLLYWFLLIHTV